MTGQSAWTADHTTRAWVATAAFMLAMMAAIAPAWFLDTRTRGR